MKRTMAVLTVLQVLLFTAGPGRASGPAISAGLAQADITPPLGCPMYGYASRKEGAVGVLDSLKARVLILKSEETVVALVSLDLGEFQSGWLQDRTHEMGIDYLLLLCSHTHAGPGFNRDDFPSPEKPLRRIAEERILKAIRAAQRDMFPAYITAGQGSIQVGYNRLRRDPDGLATTIFENHDHIPYGPVDPTVGVIRVDDARGRTRAVLVNYACHPVVLGSRNLKISADYVGVLCRLVEEELGAGVQCMFAQGGCGDINPLHQGRSRPVDYEKDYALVVKVGQLLAGEVLGILSRMEDRRGKSARLRAASDVLTVNHRWERGQTLRLGVTSLLINGEIGIIAIPGEPFHDFQFQLREKSALLHAYFFGYCDNSHQDWPDYLPDIPSAARGGYGASDSGIAEVGTGERLVNRGLVQLYTLRGMLFPEPRRGRRP